jgi:cytochrome c biogenesis protein CcdA
MESLLLAAGTALWLGVLTSISPCPLATNIAAISYIGKRVDRQPRVLLAGLLYTLGRTLAYFLVALLIVKSLVSMSAVSMFLQRHASQALGPVLIVVGVLLLDVIPWPWTGRGSSVLERLRGKAEQLGLAGAALLGMIFALAFCPVSAALFFGSLIPLSLRHQSWILMPTVYGVGTALPVVVFSLILAFAANRLSRAFSALTAIERWLRRLTAAVFILVGGYYCLVYIFEVL